MDALSLFVAQDEGYFKDAGLNVRLETGTSGNQLATSVSSGAMKIAYGAVQIVAQAHDRGFKYQYLWPSDFYESGKTPVAAMMVPKGSSVTTAKGLVGKAVNPVAIQSLGDLATQAWLKKSNLPPNSVHEVEVAFPNIGAAFQSKQLAASIVIEPYITILKNQGARVMSDDVFSAIAPRFAIGGWFSTDQWIKGNPKAAREFTAAIKKAVVFINAHKSQARTILAKYTKLSSSIAARTSLPTYSNTWSYTDFQSVIDAGAKLKFYNGFKAQDILSSRPPSDAK